MKKLTLLWLDDCRDSNTYNYIARFSPIGMEVRDFPYLNILRLPNSTIAMQTGLVRLRRN